jgi:hypothetical protein
LHFFLRGFVLVPRVTAAGSHFFSAPLAKTFAAYTKPLTPKHFRNIYSNDVMIGMCWNLMSPPPYAPPLDAAATTLAMLNANNRHQGCSINAATPLLAARPAADLPTLPT